MTVTLDLGIEHVLTLVTILVSVGGLIFSWSKSRLARESERADRVRQASSEALTKLDRWQDLNQSLYQSLQHEFIKTSEMLQDKFDVEKARDYLWKTISTYRTQIAARIIDESITTSYVGLIPYFPELRSQFINLFDELRSLEEFIVGEFLEASQRDVLSFEGRNRNYTSAALGNALRSTASSMKDKFTEKSTELIRPMRERLFEIIAKSDQAILHPRRVVPRG